MRIYLVIGIMALCLTAGFAQPAKTTNSITSSETKAERIARHQEKIKAHMRESQERRKLGDTNPAVLVTTVTGEGRSEKKLHGQEARDALMQWKAEHKPGQATTATAQTKQ